MIIIPDQHPSDMTGVVVTASSKQPKAAWLENLDGAVDVAKKRDRAFVEEECPKCGNVRAAIMLWPWRSSACLLMLGTWVHSHSGAPPLPPHRAMRSHTTLCSFGLLMRVPLYFMSAAADTSGQRTTSSNNYTCACKAMMWRWCVATLLARRLW